MTDWLKISDRLHDGLVENFWQTGLIARSTGTKVLASSCGEKTVNKQRVISPKPSPLSINCCLFKAFPLLGISAFCRSTGTIREWEVCCTEWYSDFHRHPMVYGYKWQFSVQPDSTLTRTSDEEVGCLRWPLKKSRKQLQRLLAVWDSAYTCAVHKPCSWSGSKRVANFPWCLYKEVAKTTSGTLMYRFERQTARKNSSFEKHCVLDLDCRILSQEPSDCCILYFNVIFHGK